MAALNARTDSFIALLLDVSGRARPGDLQGMSPAEAAESLQQFAAAHPERSLAYDGDALVPASAAAPVSPPAPSPPAVDDGMFEFGPAEVAVPPAVESPTAMGGPAAPAAAGIPGLAGSEPAISPTQVPAETADWPTTDAAPSTSDFLDLPPLEGAGAATGIAPRVPIYWWLLAVLLGWLGGLVGWLVLRKGNPKGARNVLIVGIAATLLTVALGVVGFALGLASLFGLAPTEPVPVAPVPVSTPATNGAETTPTGSEASATP